MLTNTYMTRYGFDMQVPKPSFDLFESWCILRDRLLATHVDVLRGKMMSADALTLHGKVFVFFSQKGGRKGLGCRVGRDADLVQFGLTDWQNLAPFKSKPPMKDWIVIGSGDLAHWARIAEHCLHLSRNKETAR